MDVIGRRWDPVILRWLLQHEALRPDEPGNEVGAITNETLPQSLENLEERRGWYVDDRERTPPWFPEHFRIVTSLGGDACQGIQNAVHGPGPDGDVLVEDASVQGDSAPRSIANGICHLDRHEDVDLVITGRGGGGDTDLTAFDIETVADAAFTASTASVIADGHADDRFVADEVADTAADAVSSSR